MIEPGDGDPRHGTYNGYRNLSCRCDDCRAANTAYHGARADLAKYRDKLTAQGFLRSGRVPRKGVASYGPNRSLQPERNEAPPNERRGSDD
jgi:hypothetical protein